MPDRERANHVRTLRDFLSVFQIALNRLPSSAEVLSVQRSVTVVDKQLEKLEDSYK